MTVLPRRGRRPVGFGAISDFSP